MASFSSSLRGLIGLTNWVFAICFTSADLPLWASSDSVAGLSWLDIRFDVPLGTECHSRVRQRSTIPRPSVRNYGPGACQGDTSCLQLLDRKVWTNS